MADVIGGRRFQDMGGGLFAEVFPAGSPTMAGAYVGAWAGRPAAALAGVGAEIVITDAPAGGRSRWYSDGVYWRPVNGRVPIGSFAGSAASPVATVTAAGENVFTLPSTMAIPAGMAAVPGVRICGDASIRRTTLAGSPLTLNFVGLLVGATPSDINSGIIAASNLAATLNIEQRLSGRLAVLSPTLVTADAYTGPHGPSTNYGEAALNLANASYVVVRANNLVAGDVVALYNVAVWLEF